MTRIAVIDHGAGNIVSIRQGLESAGARTRLVAEPAELGTADAIVLPGVGSTGAAMRRLGESGLADAIRQWQGPLLGICVGLQLFFESSEEDDGDTLGLLGGTVARLEADRLPHIGWNDIDADPSEPIFAGVGDTPFYFVHSFAPVPADPAVVVGTTTHERTTFCSAVRSGLIVGVQFHPERSGRAGARILANFVSSVREPANAA